MNSNDRRFIDQIEACLPPEQGFAHLDHLRLAWLYLQCLPTDEAIAQTATTIRRFATSVGAAQKFHATITHFLMCYLASLRAQRGDCSWQEMCERNPSLLSDCKGICQQYYSESVLNSEQARDRILPPDKMRCEFWRESLTEEHHPL